MTTRCITVYDYLICDGDNDEFKKHCFTANDLKITRHNELAKQALRRRVVNCQSKTLYLLAAHIVYGRRKRENAKTVVIDLNIAVRQ